MTKGKRSFSDLRNYRRLITYLRGMNRFMLGVFVCMLLEGIFTVITISSMKPLLDLLVNKRLVSSNTHHLTIEVSDRVDLGPGIKGFRVAGAVGNTHTANDLRDSLAATIETVRTTESPGKVVLADLRGLKQLAPAGWASLWVEAAEARKWDVTIHALVPPGTQRPRELGVVEGLIIAEDTSSLDPQVAQALENIPVPMLARKAPGMLTEWKQKLTDRVTPYLERVQAYSMASPQNKFRVLGIIIGGMLFSAICMALASLGVGYLSAYLANKSVQRLRSHVFSHMLDLDMSYFNATSTGNLMSTVLQDVTAVDSAIDVLFSSVLKTPITVLMLVAYMFFISPSLTLFSFTVLPLIGFLLVTLGKRVRKVSSRVQKIKGALAAVLEEAFGSIRVVKAFNMENYERRRFEKENSSIVKLTLKTKIAEELGTGLTQVLGVLTVSVMVLAGGYFVLRTNQLSGSEFVLFVVLLSQVFRPLKGISKTNSRIQRGLAGCDRVFAVLDMQPTIADRENAVEVGPLAKEIEFRDVTFSYGPGTKPILNKINLCVPAGKAIALVGETGAGKSTLVNLLPRFYDPTEGAVFYDGLDLRDVQVKSLRNQIALITQDVVLFNDTVANNIAYGSKTPVSRDAIINACKAAKAHDFIMQKPEGYDTVIGARGVRLSGGERQRIAIARALIKNAPILILDEATSALDSETEALIQEALANVIKGRTVFVIAHRLSTIQNCDEIYVLEHGRFAEHGTHLELLAKGGRYSRYHQIQFGTASAGAA